MTPYFTDDWLTVYQGDCREVMASMEPESVHCVVTSPPYWGLRDYGVGGQLGLEPTPEEYVANMVGVFREVRRVLRDDGTVWLNLGDSYSGSGKGGNPEGSPWKGFVGNAQREEAITKTAGEVRIPPGLKPKDLVGIPWRVAFALQQPYYAGSIRNELDRVWLAAMIDAEGCIYVHRRQAGLSNGQGYVRKNDTHGAGLEVSNTNEAIVQRCIDITGRGSISRQEKDRRQPLYRWNLRTNECRDVLREVYPYLIAKKQQARIAIGCPASGEKAEAAFLALQGLHHGSGTTLDFPEPASMLEPGWYLRSDVIWSKPNPMPESVTDRPTKSHEYLFLLSKSARYYFDAEAVAEAGSPTSHGGTPTDAGPKTQGLRGDAGTLGVKARPSVARGGFQGKTESMPGRNAFRAVTATRNIRSVWTIATQPYPGAHFATFPPKLVEPCVKAGCPQKVCGTCGASWERVTERDGKGPQFSPLAIESAGVLPDGPGTHRNMGGRYQKWLDTNPKATTGWRATCAHEGSTTSGVVLDPFGGSGTTGMVAQALGRRAVLIDLNGDYLVQAMRRNAQSPLGLDVA